MRFDSDTDSDADPERVLRETSHCAGEGDAPGRGEWLLAFAGVLILTDCFDAPLHLLFGRDVEIAPGLPLTRLLLLAVFAATAILLAPRLRPAWQAARAVWPLWPALLLCVASALWSAEPRTTLLWSAALLGTSAFGVALAVRFAPGAQALLVLAAAATGGVLSLLSPLWPALAGGRERGWQGVFVHKNVLGRMMGWGVAAAAALPSRSPAALGGAVVCAALLLLSRSRGAWLVAAATVGAVVVMRLARPRRYRAVAAAGVVGGALGIALLIGTEPGLALLGRDATFSRRTRIWSAVVAATTDRQWLGHGYAAFWRSGAGFALRQGFTFPFETAHNGFLDIYVELGIAGLLAVCAPLAFYTAKALRHALMSAPRVCLWPAACVLFLIASNVAESQLLRHKLGWALYVAAACHLATRRPPSQ